MLYLRLVVASYDTFVRKLSAQVLPVEISVSSHAHLLQYTRTTIFVLFCYSVLPAISRLEWNRAPDNREIARCCMRWTETVLQLNYQVFKECEQMVSSRIT